MTEKTPEQVLAEHDRYYESNGETGHPSHNELAEALRAAIKERDDLLQRDLAATETIKAMMADDFHGLEAKLKIAMAAIEDIMFTTTSMPAAWNDELSWYSGQLSSCIGRAARLHAKLKEMP